MRDTLNLCYSREPMGMTAKEKKARRQEQRLYGLKKIRKGEKFCWFSYENKNGWSLGLAFEKYTLWLRNVRFSSKVEVERAVSSPVNFSEMKHKRV